MTRLTIALGIAFLALLGAGRLLPGHTDTPDGSHSDRAGASSAADAEPPQEGARPLLPASMASNLRFSRETISGERARAMVARMDPSYRVPGNHAFEAAIQMVVETLREAGYKDEATDPDGPLTFRIEHRELSQPTWEPHAGSLSIAGMDTPLLEFRRNVNLLAANSFPTEEGGVEAELVDVGDGSATAFEGVDIAGKIVMGDASVGQLFRRAVQEGDALGVLAYRFPAFNRPEVNRTITPMSSIPYDAEARSWGLLLSLEARDALRAALAQGPVRVRVNVDTELFPSEELTLVAEVRGSSRPEERFVYSAHVQESGANDNATGVAALAEIARSFGDGLRTGSFTPRRTITMLWGDEIISTRRYLQDDPARAEDVLFGMSLDMVGEDTEKTGGTFLIEKMPDPSAVWTRGDDHHTEWGGRPLSVDQLTPSFYNDFVLNRCLDQAAESGWVVRTNPFEGGSDHVPFLQAGVQGILLWHFTDQFYHTDGDRIGMVSANTLENVSVCASTSAMALTTADSETAVFLAGELQRAAIHRIQAEAALSRAALDRGEDPEEQRLILSTWTDWYLGAVDTLTGIEVNGPSPSLTATMEETRERIREAGRQALESLAR